jgi:hypothetical protein
MKRKSGDAREWGKPLRAPRLKGWRGVKSRASLMRINHAHGVSMGHITNASHISSRDILWNHYGDQRVKVTRQDAAALRWLWRRDETQSSTSSKGAAYRLTTARQPLAGSGLESACLEMAGGVPHDLASKPATSRLDDGSWDFDGNKLTSARIRTRRSPMQTHETSPVSGASVVGMTYGAC